MNTFKLHGVPHKLHCDIQSAGKCRRKPALTGDPVRWHLDLLPGLITDCMTVYAQAAVGGNTEGSSVVRAQSWKCFVVKNPSGDSSKHVELFILLG